MEIFEPENIARVHTEGHTSKGDQPKWTYKGNWYKADHMGYEALAEVVVSLLLKKSSVENFVAYQPVLIKYDGRTCAGCKSKNFRAGSEQLIPFERLHRVYGGVGLAQKLAGLSSAEEKIKYTVDFVAAATGLSNVGNYISMLLELDAFFLNEDRHTNNLAVIRNESTLAFRLCPVFDNGLALLSDVHDYPLGRDIYNCISHVKAKPFDIDFYEQICAAEKLYGSPLKFDFTKKDVSEILTELTSIYDKNVLLRVEQILFEQMRKYPFLFEH